VQFGINSTSEWLLITRGDAKCNYANHEVIPNCTRKHAIDC